MIDLRQVTARYASRPEPTIDGIDLHIDAGELVLVSGPTGCGKSTLINCINGVLVHESDAVIEGEIRVGGLDVRATPLDALCRVVGSVFQNPDTQLCTATPETEVAFGLENLAVLPLEMAARVSDALETVGLAAQRHQPVGTLSGGQKQRLAIACALAMHPKVLLLDEPISQLDPGGAEEILDTLARLREEHDRAVLVVEHRLEEVARLAGRVVIMDAGRIAHDLSCAKAFLDLAPLRKLGLSLPHLPDLFCRLGRPERPFLPEEAPLLPARPRGGKPAPERPAAGVAVQVSGLDFAYGKRLDPVFSSLDLALYAGERVALMGANGSGKSTLLNLLAGALRPGAGAVRWAAGDAARVGLVVQQPDLMLFQPTLWDEACFAPSCMGLDEAEQAAAADAALTRMSLASLRAEPAFALSRGQRLRAAIASVLSMQPTAVLLDEPTTGQDRDQIERMMDGLAEDLDLLVFCTHDVDTAARHATRVILLSEGAVLADGPTREVLLDVETLRTARIRPTSAQAYGRRLGVDALSVEELVEALR